MSQNFRLDEGNYEPSDSDEDYSEHEKTLLRKIRSRTNDSSSDSEKEVYSVDGSEDNDSSAIALSDVEGQGDDDDLPDARAWGRDKKGYYGTNYVDRDYGGYHGKDAALAELEEEEARNLQKQLAKELDEGDFSLDLFTKPNEKENRVEVGEQEVIKTDVGTLSRRQKLQLLKKESPEFFELVEDFKGKMGIVREFLVPIKNLVKADKISRSKAVEFVDSYYSLILNYCSNICMYLLLKSMKTNVQHHPIVKRLFQFRQYLKEMDAIFEETIEKQITLLLEMEEIPRKPVKKPKTLKLLSDLNRDNVETSPHLKSIVKVEKPLEIKSVKFSEELSADETDSKEDVENKDQNEVEDVVSESDRRAITYQMAKNKGLTPHRKKEQRNPRVKHRNKFRKAKIRRKGAVREVRKELSRYGGETSGIKASVTKSIKLK